MQAITYHRVIRWRRPSDWLDGPIDVGIGLNNLQAEEKSGNAANIVRVTLHPDYKEVTGGRGGVVNDVAIVTLDRDVSSTQVCLPGDIGRERNSQAVVIGFGKVVKRGRGSQQDKLR